VIGVPGEDDVGRAMLSGLTLGLVLVASGPEDARADGSVRLGIGHLEVKGDPGEVLLGNGIELHGEGLYRMSPRVHVGLRVGMSVNGEHEHGGYPITSDSTVLTAEARFRAHVLDLDRGHFTPYVAAGLGFGRADWTYADELEAPIEEDGIWYRFAAPEVGFEAMVGPTASFDVGARFLVGAHPIATDEGFAWQLGDARHVLTFVSVASHFR